MSNLKKWPPEPPQKPLWRGIGEDIQGRTGDPLFGLYLRSSNFHVLDGGRIRKRRGTERAADELFTGGSAAALAEYDGGRVMLFADGEGIKSTSGVVPAAYDRIDERHSGFVNDTFDRADSLTIADTGKFWSEGDDSEIVSGRTAGDGFQILSNALWGNQALIDPTAEWDVEAPTPWAAYRIGLDFTNALNGASNGDKANVRFVVGLPPAVFDASQTQTKARIRMIDAIQTVALTSGGASLDHAWSGVYFALQLRQVTASNFSMTLIMKGFGSSESPFSLADRQGGVAYSEQTTVTGLSASDAKGKWVVEIGRQRKNGGRWWDRAYLWKGKSVADLLQGTQGAATASVVKGNLHEGLSAETNPSLVHALPVEGRGGHFGVNMEHTVASGTSSISITRAATSLSFFDE